MPKATIARTVVAVGGVARSNGADTAPATITRAWGFDQDKKRSLVNLMVFPDASNQPRSATSVYLYGTEDEARETLQHDDMVAAFWPVIG